MSYTYLLDLYSALNQRIVALDKLKDNQPDLSAEQVTHLAGRRDCLESFYDYLQDNYDQKLPRRLQQQFREKN